jgi:hypothetical protein
VGFGFRVPNLEIGVKGHPFQCRGEVAQEQMLSLEISETKGDFNSNFLLSRYL